MINTTGRKIMTEFFRGVQNEKQEESGGEENVSVSEFFANGSDALTSWNQFWILPANIGTIELKIYSG